MGMEFVYDGFVDELRSIDEAGAFAPAFSFVKVARPASWMSRSELLSERKKLQNKYFQIGAGTVASGAALGAAVGGISPKLIAAKITNPGVKSMLRRASIPTAVVGSLIAAASLPNIRRNRVLKDLMHVDARLKHTSSTSLRRMNKKASAESGHWRTLPGHWEGEGKHGEKIKGRTWVDTKPRPKAATKKIPPPRLIAREEGKSVFAIPTGDGGATLFIMDSRIEEDFVGLIRQGGDTWASKDEVVDFMAEAEERGIFAIYLAEGKG